LARAACTWFDWKFELRGDSGMGKALNSFMMWYLLRDDFKPLRGCALSLWVSFLAACCHFPSFDLISFPASSKRVRKSKLYETFQQPPSIKWLLRSTTIDLWLLCHGGAKKGLAGKSVYIFFVHLRLEIS
jgi:hypothetical protein